MGAQKTNILGVAVLAVMLAGAAAGAVEKGRVVERERVGPAVIAVIFVEDSNRPARIEPGVRDTGRDRLAERVADTDLSTRIKVYCRLAEETLRWQDRPDERRTEIRYVYLSRGADWAEVTGGDAERNLLRHVLPTLLEDNGGAAGRKTTVRAGEDLGALDAEALWRSPEVILSDPMAVETARRLWERARAEQVIESEVSYGDRNGRQRQWSQAVVPEPSTVALMAIGAAVASRRGKRKPVK